MKITDDLNLAVPVVFREDGSAKIWAYHTPVERAVFEEYYQILTGTLDRLFSKGVGYAASMGPRIAHLVLLDEARDLARRENAPDIEAAARQESNALLAELERLTLIGAPTENGYEQLPVGIAVARGIIDQEDKGELLSRLVFFTSTVSTATKITRKNMAETSANILKSSLTSLSFSGYLDSLGKSTPTLDTTQAAALSVPT